MRGATTDLPANTRALDGDSDFAVLQGVALGEALDRGLGLVDPEIMVGVGEDTNVGLGGLELGSGAGHVGGWVTASRWDKQEASAKRDECGCPDWQDR